MCGVGLEESVQNFTTVMIEPESVTDQEVNSMTLGDQQGGGG